MNTDRLNELSFDEFKRLVERDVKGQLAAKEQGVPALLRDPEVVERWCAALSALLRSVEGQLSTQQADMRGRLEFHSRKAESAREALEELVIRGDESKISQGRDRVRTHEQAAAQIRQTFWEDRMRKLRFRSGVAEQYVEAKALRDQLDRWARLRMVTEERNAVIADLTSLRCAVSLHRSRVMDDSMTLDADVIDDLLWEAAGLVEEA